MRSATGTMAPFSAFATVQLDDRAGSADALQRPAGASRSRARPAPGVSTGTAMHEMDKLVEQAAARASATNGPACPIRKQQSGAQAPALYAPLDPGRLPVPGGALRELVDPALGDAGDSAGRGRRGARRPRCAGFYNDIYFQVGLLTTIGLSAKNAILIVEFAEEAEKRGADAVRGGAWRRRACGCGRS